MGKGEEEGSEEQGARRQAVMRRVGERLYLYGDGAEMVVLESSTRHGRRAIGGRRAGRERNDAVSHVTMGVFITG